MCLHSLALWHARTCAVTCHANAAITLIGRYARRAGQGDAEAREQLADLFVHAIRREYPELDDGTLDNRTAKGGINPAKVVAFSREVMHRLAALSVSWVRVG